MPAGTIYMYYAHGGDSLNISAQGSGNAVLIKSAIPYVVENSPQNMLETMQKLNPNKNSYVLRDPRKLCSGQTLLCKSLNLKVTNWNQKKIDPRSFYLEDVGYYPNQIIQTIRLGIPKGRDEHLPYRFIDYTYASQCISNPLAKRKWRSGKDYCILQQ
jgi:DNA-3-methyladenine glycosylase